MEGLSSYEYSDHISVCVAYVEGCGGLLGWVEVTPSHLTCLLSEDGVNLREAGAGGPGPGHHQGLHRSAKVALLVLECLVTTVFLQHPLYHSRIYCHYTSPDGCFCNWSFSLFFLFPMLLSFWLLLLMLFICDMSSPMLLSLSLLNLG